MVKRSPNPGGLSGQRSVPSLLSRLPAGPQAWEQRRREKEEGGGGRRRRRREALAPAAGVTLGQCPLQAPASVSRSLQSCALHKKEPQQSAA